MDGLSIVGVGSLKGKLREAKIDVGQISDNDLLQISVIGSVLSVMLVEETAAEIKELAERVSSIWPILEALKNLHDKKADG